MTPCSGIVCAAAGTGSMPGRASAAEGKIEVDSTSVTATPASADAVAAAGSLLARVDVLRRLGVERIGIELHFALGEIAFLPRLRRVKRRAARGRQKRDDTQRSRDRRVHRRGAIKARIF